MCLKQPMFLGHIILQLPCGLHYMVQVRLLPLLNVLSKVCVHCPVRSFSVVSCRAFKPRAVIFSKIMAKNYPSTAKVYTRATMEGLSVENLARGQIYQKFSLTYQGKFR